MQRYSLREAQDHLQQLIDDAKHGKTVLILDEHDQTVQLVPVTISDAGAQIINFGKRAVHVA
jgi:antitoxin (DNA-binding transcriptional repressor) of toxin-antitoxin stability system